MKAKLLSIVVGLGLLLVSFAARADCVDVFGCVCGAYDLVVVATVLEVKEDGYISVELERIEGTVPGAADPWQVGEVVDALPDMQVRQGARAYLTNAGPGATDLLVQFNQADASGEVACSGVVFGEEEFIETALAADCHDRAKARGIEANCVDESHCAVTRARLGHPGRSPATKWLWGLALALSLVRRHRSR